MFIDNPNISVTLRKEKRIINLIENYAQEVIWHMRDFNLNYSFVIFSKFKKLNRSFCYKIPTHELIDLDFE